MPELPEERQAQPVPTPPDDDESEAEDEDDDTDEPPDSGSGRAAEARSSARPQAAATAPDPGDQYVSRLTESLSGTVATDLDGHIAEILAIVQSAESPDDYDAIRQKIVDYYRDRMDPGAIADLTRAGLVLAQLAGRFTVLGEVADGEP
jgi:hypothetical protein